MDHKIKVFIFATLMDNRLLTRLIGTHLEEDQVYFLKGYHMVENIYPSLEKMEGSAVSGKVIHISPEQLTKLQKWEEDYTPEPITLQPNNTTALAFIKKKEAKEFIKEE